MTADLRLTVAELGPGYGEVVDRLMAAEAPYPGVVTDAFRRQVLWRTAFCLTAASIAVWLGVSAIVSRRPSWPVRSGSSGFAVYTAAYASDGAALAAIVASQRADGSWANDYLTRQNAAALRGATDESARIAFKRAARYLRSKGLEPLSAEELRLRGESAAKDARARS